MSASVLGIDPAHILAAVANACVETIPVSFNPATVDDVLQRCGPPGLLIGRHVFVLIDDLADVLSAARQPVDASGVFACEGHLG